LKMKLFSQLDDDAPAMYSCISPTTTENFLMETTPCVPTRWDSRCRVL
jgi:hypothetical protein